MTVLASIIRRWLGAATVAVAVLAGAGPALAHPHVWVTSASELVYAPDGSITGVRHAWTFDEMFSTYALQGIDTATKGVYTREDLTPLAKTNIESLQEYDFFTFVSTAGRSQGFVTPTDYYLEYVDGALVLHFMLPFKTPLKARKLSVEIYDASFFVDFTLRKKDPFHLVNGPAGCVLDVKGPKSDKPEPGKISEDQFESGSLENMGGQFASKIEVACP